MTGQSNRPEFRIEPAGPEDAPILLALIKELAAYERLSDQVSATEDLLRQTLFGPGSPAEAFLLYWAGEPVGYCLFFHTFSTFLGRPGLYVEDLYVTPRARGRGLGRAALAQAARIARERGCARLEFAVLDWNEPAIKFYRGLGAEALDDWTTFRLTGPALDELAGLKD